MNIKKKILFLVTQSEFGGAQRFIYTLIEGMRKYTQIESRQVGNTQTHAEENEFLYSDITYKIRGACFKIWKEFRGAYKEKIVEKALLKELQNQGLTIETQKQISVIYENENIGKYVPDMIVDDKVLVELKSKTFITKEDEKQFWLYLKGSNYKLGLLINFGKKLEIKRRVYDTAREKSLSASISVSPKADNQRISVNYEIVIGAGPEGDNANGLLFNLKNSGFKTINLKFLRRKINPIFDLRGLIEIYRILKIEKPNILFLCSTKTGVLGSVASYFYSKFQRKSAPSDYQRESAYSSEARLDQRLSAKLPKVIYRIGGWTFNDPWPNWKKKMYIWIEKYTAGFKDFIINNAESDRQQAIKLGIKPKNEIVTIHNGLDIDKLEFLSREEARKELKIENSKFVVGTIANFYPPKGLEYFIETASLVNNKEIKFIIIGDGEDRPKLEELIKKYNLKDNIILTGTIPDARNYLKAFDVFILSSVKEGFPWAVLEAMTAEVSVIATKVGAIPEMIENNKNGILVDIRNPEQIRDAVNLLLQDEELRLSIAREGRKTASEKFSIQKMVNKFEELF